MFASFRNRSIYYFRNYAWIFATLCVFAICWYVWNTYVAIVSANFACLALATLVDYGMFLKLQSLKSRRDRLMNKDAEIVQDEVVVESRSRSTRKVTLKVPPSRFAHHVDFCAAFKFHYLTEDTEKFIVSFAGNVRRSFFVSCLAALVIFVVFGGSENGAVSSSKDVSSGIIATAITCFQWFVLYWPFAHFHERNQSALSS